MPWVGIRKVASAAVRRPSLSVHGGADTEVVVGVSPSVLAARLADPAAPAAWFPIALEVEGHTPTRWRVGSRFAVVVGIAGENVHMAVTVDKLDATGLAFVAEGAVRLDGILAFEAVDGDPHPTRVRARVDVIGHGLGGDALAGAAVTLLRGGALHRALRTVKREVEQAGT